MNAPYLFAPGCTLQREQPALAAKMHRYLEQVLGRVALHGSCCRAAAAIPSAVVVTACPACRRVYEERGLAVRPFREIRAEMADVYPFEESEA